MSKTFTLLFFASFIVLAFSAKHSPRTIGVEQSVARFKVDSKSYALSLKDLSEAIRNIDPNQPGTIDIAKTKLIYSRLAYKRIEYFLEHFFFTSSRIYNRPPKNEIEEPHLEYMEPAGMQYMEAILFDSITIDANKELLVQAELLSNAANDLHALLYKFETSDKQVLAAVRLELIRIIALGITGFDAPMLKSGIWESAVAMETIALTLKPYLDKNKQDSVFHYLGNSIWFLQNNPEFDSFDRLKFLKAYALPLQKHLNVMIREMQLDSVSPGMLRYDAGHMFSPGALQPADSMNDKDLTEKRAELGKKLFFETRLSGNGSKSCASCHNPANYFTDGLPKSIGLHPHTQVRRNAPSLFYAAAQQNQFWDGRAKTLEDQIETVLRDSSEMNAIPAQSMKLLLKDKSYKRLFKKAFPKTRKEKKPGEQQIYTALAAFIKTLNPYNSDFDRYIAGDQHALTDAQVSGFNLFMGKAQCGTCHFAPLFNGLIPPFYALTEFEVIGTTATDDLLNPKKDLDNGRMDVRVTPYYEAAFKTPTVRNAAVTGPYMHNGAFNSLEKVIDFYDKGGGAGLGLDLPRQTLSPLPLNLTDQEKKDIIAFLHALTDKI
ncbi:cytochrome-c peroxidase [Dyadobacter fanqingshengii]|uniref:Cytochrome C peroxidase n=1 Tax=Dyadobacter fanqingshengii TaxID=2906443 RepID=A0A9X1P9W6_9BACT|nr:cytochrome c peroxidase [Dyadobacter fanqingshengii]MCF0040675.1 cytochrome C peroxidase [Dyadobacter fanqingshengii]USJ37587.1 cytochrome C peroxidase [Dyadobacter fanqingshengii]